MKRPPLEVMRIERLPGIGFFLCLRRYPKKGFALVTIVRRDSRERVLSEIFLWRAETGPLAEALIRELSAHSR